VCDALKPFYILKMKKFALINFFFVSFTVLHSQPIYDAKRNYHWISGYLYDNIVYNEAVDNVIYDFTGDTMKLVYEEKYPSSEVWQTNGSICDENGDLLLYSAGCRVHEKEGTIVPGTDSMNVGFVYNAQCYDYMGNPNSGYTIPEGLLFLPVGLNNYFIFYQWLDYQGNGYNILRLYSMSLKKNTDNQHFTASDINKIILSDNLNGDVAACRSGNGLDWWLLCPKANSNRIFSFLIDSNGVKEQKYQNIGVSRIHPWDDSSGQCAFSPDGTKFIEYNIRSDLKIFDFDRCTGTLSNPIHIPIVDAADTIYAAGVCVSPNSRYLYACSTRKIYQFDLQADNIPASKLTVAVNDGVKIGFLPLNFNHAELGPDGRIYINNLFGRTTYHRIDYPDSAGVACGVRQHIEWTQWGMSTMPHHPNYLLGAVQNNGCDSTITTINTNQPVGKLKVYPNPVGNQLTIELENMPSTIHLSGEIVVINQVGQVVHKQPMSPYIPLAKIESKGWAAGVYIVSLRKGGRLLGVERVVKIAR
jgi:hypothetical protein